MSAFNPECVDVEDFLECLEIRNVTRATAAEYRFSCPFPNHTNGDENASAYMNEETTAFFCHGCKERGNATSFTAQVLGISPLEAIRMLKQRYQPGGINPDSVSMVEELKKFQAEQEISEAPQPELSEDVLKRFDTDWFQVAEALTKDYDSVPEPFKYMQRRGFGPDVLTKWEFGYDPISDRITMPVRDERGKLVGFKARAYDDRQPKYLVLGDKPNKPERYGFPCYFPSRVCFGAHMIPDNCELVVCEGELNAIAVTEKTGRPAVAINGSHFSDRHARIIRNFAKRVILFLDEDKAGEAAVWGWVDKDGHYRPGIIERLKDFMPVLLTPAHEEDAAELPAEQIESLLENSESALIRILQGSAKIPMVGNQKAPVGNSTN